MKNNQLYQFWKSKKTIVFIVQMLLLATRVFAATSNGKHNSWIDLPVTETIEYFTVLMAQGLKWARKYAFLFGIIGIIWNALKVQMNRMKPVQLLWDTTFKWLMFTVFIVFYPSIVYGFLGIATEIGEKAGMGKDMVKQSLQAVYDQTKTINNEAKATALTNQIASKTGTKPKTKYNIHDTYIIFLEKLKSEYSVGINVPVFDTKKDIEAANAIIDNAYAEEDADATWYSGLTIKALNSVITEKKLDGSEGDDLTDSYVSLRTYLVDRDGNDTYFISPAAMLRLAILCGSIMYDRYNYQYSKEDAAIDDEDWGISKMGKKIAHSLSSIPSLIELLFCMLVLVLAIAMVMIQYIMTIIEYVIVTGIAVIFLPLMLFDGTKDIPKKFIPLMISYMIKIICMLICMYFVMYLLTEHTLNVLTESWGINLFAVAEVFFIAALCYVLTQNAPKVAQAIMTGQPQLSMGEALAGAGTALATGAAMKQAPHAATMAAARTKNKVNDVGGAIAKSNAASKAMKESLGDNATKFQRMKAGAMARGAVASQGLKDRMKAKFESAGQESGSGFSMVDKATQQFGLSKSGSGFGGGGGGAAGSSAYGQTGQGSGEHKGEILNNTSNPNFKSATKYDEKTGQQRHMTAKEFRDEKRQQGRNIAAKMIERANAKKVENSDDGGSDNSLPDSLTGNERGNS